MAGWRDVEGRTSAERRSASAETARRSFFEAMRDRPASLMKPLLGFAFILLLVFALIAAMS